MKGKHRQHVAMRAIVITAIIMNLTLSYESRSESFTDNYKLSFFCIDKKIY